MPRKKNEHQSRTFNKEELKITPKETIPVQRDKFNKRPENPVNHSREEDGQK